MISRKLFDVIEKGKWKKGENESRNENINGSLFGMTYIMVRKDSVRKDFELRKVKNIIMQTVRK